MLLDSGVVPPFCLGDKSESQISLFLLLFLFKRLLQKAAVSESLRTKTVRIGGSVGRQAQMTPMLISTTDQNNIEPLDPAGFLSVRERE